MIRIFIPNNLILLPTMLPIFSIYLLSPLLVKKHETMWINGLTLEVAIMISSLYIMASPNPTLTHLCYTTYHFLNYMSYSYIEFMTSKSPNSWLGHLIDSYVIAMSTTMIKEIRRRCLSYMRGHHLAIVLEYYS